MSSNFAYRYVSLTPEHTTSTGVRSYGTASAGSDAELFGEVDDESFQHLFELLTRNDMSHYGVSKSLNGKEYSEGGLNLVAQGDDFCGMLFYGVYGDKSSADSTAYTFDGSTETHTFKEGKDHILPSFTIKVGREDKEHTYTGMCVSRLGLSATVGEYVTLSADFTGKAESAQGALESSVTYTGSGADGLHFADGVIKFSSDGAANSAVASIKSISFEINTNLNTDDACSIGSQTYSRQPEPQLREITGTIEFSRPVMTADASTDAPSYAQLTATDGLAYTGDAADAAISAQFSSAGTGDIKFEVFKCRFEAPSVNVSGRDSSTMTVNFVGLYDTTVEAMSRTTVIVEGNAKGRYSTL